MAHELPEIFTPDMLREGMVLLINKPKGWSSFDVVNKMTWAMRRKYRGKIKAGHAGTLDPEATGLLIICTGKATKTIDSYQGQEKVYTGSMIIGATTPSYDIETEPDATYSIANITPDLIKETAQTFIGTTLQTPPAYSAVKVNGERAYELARRGEAPELKAKEITLTKFDITDVRIPEVWFEISCSKGTYIRSLVNDMGKKMGCGAYMKTLERTKIGEYSLADAITAEEFIQRLG